MTISSTSRKAGPYTADGNTRVFPFGFKVFKPEDVAVVQGDDSGVEFSVAPANYTVTLNANQDNTPGGNVAFSVAPPTGARIVVASAVPNLQPVELTNQGGFYPEVINTALDRSTIQIQQLHEQVSRAVKVGVASENRPDELIAGIFATAKQTTGARDAAALAASEAQAARDAMQVGSGNLLPNAALSTTIRESSGRFMPDGWANDRYFPTPGTWAAVSYHPDYKPEGVEYIAVYRPGGSTDQAYLRCNRFSVVGGNWYEGSAHAVGDNCTWYLRLHFFGAAGDYVGTGTVGTAAKGAGYLSKNLSTWQRLFGVVQAPASATSAVLSMEMPQPPAAVPYDMMFMARPYVGVARGPSQALPSPWSPSGPGPQTATHLIAEDPHPQYLGKHIAVAGGTADALHITFDRAPSSWNNLHGTPIWIKASAANTSTSPTLSITGLPGAKTLVKGANAALAVGDVAGAGHWLCVQYDATLDKVVLLNPATGVNTVVVRQIQTVGATVAANAMTVTLNPTSLDFRSTTLNSGAVNTRTVPSQLSITIPSTATLGTTSAVASRILVLAIDNAGTVELAVYNAAGGANLDETGVINTTTIAGGSNSLTVYSQTARTGVPYRIVGYVDSTQATAGTWATAPSAVQGIGGQALAAMSSIGYGQTWRDLTGSKAFNTTYYNTTGKPILVSIATNATWSGGRTFSVNGVVVDTINCASTVNIQLGVKAIVPPGASYSYNGTFTSWFELR